MIDKNTLNNNLESLMFNLVIENQKQIEQLKKIMIYF